MSKIVLNMVKIQSQNIFKNRLFDINFLFYTNKLKQNIMLSTTKSF